LKVFKNEGEKMGLRNLLHKLGLHWWKSTGKRTRKCRICNRREVSIAGIGAADWVKEWRENGLKKRSDEK